MKPRTTAEFLDVLKAKKELKSDYALAKLLDTSRQVISHYRNGKGGFDEEMAIKVANFLGIPPGYVIACVHEERTKRPEVKRIWHEIAKALAPVFVAGIIGGSALLASPGGEASESTNNIHYTNSRRRRVWASRMPQNRRFPHGRPMTHPRQLALLPIPHRLHA